MHFHYFHHTHTHTCNIITAVVFLFVTHLYSNLAKDAADYTTTTTTREMAKKGRRSSALMLMKTLHTVTMVFHSPQPVVVEYLQALRLLLLLGFYFSKQRTLTNYRVVLSGEYI